MAMSSLSEPTSVITLRNNMGPLRRDSRDPRGIPEEPPQVSPLFPDVALDRAFWVEALTLCHCHSSTEPLAVVAGHSGSLSVARARDEGTPSTTGVADVSGDIHVSSGSGALSNGVTTTSTTPLLSRGNLAIVEHSSWLHRKLFQRYLAQAGVVTPHRDGLREGGESGVAAAAPPCDAESTGAAADGVGESTDRSGVAAPSASLNDRDVGCSPVVQDRRIGISATSLESILADVGAPCGPLTAAAIAKNLKYATLDVRDIIREHALHLQSGQSPQQPQPSASCAHTNGSSAVVLTEANVSLLLRAVSTVLARRLVAQRLYRQTLQTRQLHDTAADSRAVHRVNSSPGTPARKIVTPASLRKGLAVTSVSLEQMPESGAGCSMAAAVEHAVTSSAQRTTGIAAVKASTPSRGTRHSFAGDTSSPTRSVASHAESVRSSSKGSAKIRNGSTAASASPARALYFVSATSSVADEPPGSARPHDGRRSSLTAAAELFSTRAAILRSDPYTRSPPVDVNGRPRSMPRSSSSGVASPHSPSPLRASMERLRASVRQQCNGGGGETALHSFSTTSLVATPHLSPDRRPVVPVVPSEVSPISRSTSLGSSTVPQRGNSSSAPPREPLTCSSSAQILRGVAPPGVAVSGPSSPSTSRGASPSGHGPVLGYNPEHHQRVVQRTFAHVGAKVQDCHISAILHASSPTTLLLPVGRRPLSPSPARQSGPVVSRSPGRAGSVGGGTTSPRGRLGAAVPAPTWDHHATLAAESQRSSRSPTRNVHRPSLSARGAAPEASTATIIDRAASQSHTAAMRSSPASATTSTGSKGTPHPPAFQTMSLSHRVGSKIAAAAVAAARESSSSGGACFPPGPSTAAPANVQTATDRLTSQQLSSKEDLETLYKRRLDEEW